MESLASGVTIAGGITRYKIARYGITRYGVARYELVRYRLAKNVVKVGLGLAIYYVT